MQIWRRVLPPLLSRFRIGAVIGAAAHYHTDWDIGTVSKRSAFPMSCCTERTVSWQLLPCSERYRSGCVRPHPFTGRMIIMHNDLARQSFIDFWLRRAGARREHWVLAYGRMDSLVRREAAIGKDALLFSFSYASGLIGRRNYATDGPLGFVDLFRQTHIAFAELAMANPGRRFVVKTKYGQSDRNAILQVLSGAGIDPAVIPNYRITVTDDPHDLIRQSAVVIAFQSTTMLEAALAARPVVVPLFAEALRPDHQPYLRFRDAYHLFLTAGSADNVEGFGATKLADATFGRGRIAREARTCSKNTFRSFLPIAFPAM